MRLEDFDVIMVPKQRPVFSLSDGTTPFYEHPHSMMESILKEIQERFLNILLLYNGETCLYVCMSVCLWQNFGPEIFYSDRP